MTDRSDGTDPAAASSESANDAIADPSSADGPGARDGRDARGAAPTADSPADRRAFLSDLSREAVSTAGRVAGFSAMLRRSVFAAGEAAAESLSTVGRDPAAQESPEPAPAPPGSIGAPEAPVSASAPIAEASTTLPPAPPDPVAKLTEDQRAFLSEMARATLAVNDPAGSPQLTSSAYHWDGAVFRLPGQQFSLRVANIERDPRVGLFIEDPSSDTSVAITGVATAVYGDQVETGMLLILGRDTSPAAALRRWAELAASGDRMVIEVRPTRFVWRAG